MGGHEQAAVRAGCREHFVALGHRERHGLFQVDVLAGVHRVDRCLVMQPVRKRPDHDFRVVPGECVLVVGHELHTRMLLLEGSDLLFPGLGDEPHLAALRRFDHIDVAAADSARAKDGYAQRH